MGVDLAPLGAAGTLAQLPRARPILDRELRDHALPRPGVCAFQADYAALEVLPGARALTESLATARARLCRNTPALEADRRAHAAAVEAVRAHLERLRVAALGG